MMNAYNRPYKEIPDYLVDDWTGTRFGKHWPTYGKEPFPPTAKKLDKWGNEWSPFKNSKDSKESKASESNFLQYDLVEGEMPKEGEYPHVDAIMKKWADKDAEKEIAANKLAVEGDPDGGLGKIYAASLRHDKDEDSVYLKEISDKWSTGGKGADGWPNRQRVMSHASITLAAEEVMKAWVGNISDNAIELFLKRNLDGVWKTYPGWEKDQIELREGPHILRELFSKEPGLPPKKNPLEIEGAKPDVPLEEVKEDKTEAVPTESKPKANDKLLAPPPALDLGAPVQGNDKLLAPPPQLGPR